LTRVSHFTYPITNANSISIPISISISVEAEPLGFNVPSEF